MELSILLVDWLFFNWNCTQQACQSVRSCHLFRQQLLWQRHLQSPPIWSSSSLTTEFIPACESGHAWIFRNHIHTAQHRAQGTQERDGSDREMDSEGGVDVAQEEWVERERRREEEPGEKWQQNKDSNAQWEGVCWPTHRNVSSNEKNQIVEGQLKFFCFKGQEEEEPTQHCHLLAWSETFALWRVRASTRMIWDFWWNLSFVIVPLNSFSKFFPGLNPLPNLLHLRMSVNGQKD